MSTARPVLALVVSAAAVLGLLTTAPAAQAVETVPRPASGVLELEGRGYGHGRGMSQWGAYGAADAGLAWRQVLDFYYPGTQRWTLPESPIRVWIGADTDNDTRVLPASGLSVTSGGATAVLPAGTQYDLWRVYRTSGGSLVLQRLDGSTWYQHPWPVTVGADATFTTSAGMVRLVRADGRSQDLRGGVRAVPYGTAPGLRTVAVMGMDQYLRSVVPAEMPASWPAEALRSQAVAARTYAARLRSDAGGAGWDTCDTTSCQVFVGTALYRSDGTLEKAGEDPRTDAAIVATSSTVLYHVPAGAPKQLAFTEFSAANGGYSAAGSAAHPYLVAKADPYDGRIPSSAHAWTTGLTVAAIEARYPSIGRLLDVSITSRNGKGEWGGRVLGVTFRGASGSVSATGDAVRSAFGLRSAWFRFTSVPAHPRDWSGDGAADVLVTAPSGALVLYPGTGTGGFGASRVIGSSWHRLDLMTQVGDWDGDGHQDLVARYPASGALWLYRGDGGGSFAGSAAIGNGWQIMDLLLGPGDWDGDGAADLLARRTNGTLWLYPGNGAGGFRPARQVGNGWSGMGLVTAAGDLTGDARPDLVARTSAGTLLVYPGTGTGGFGAPAQIGTGWSGIDALTGPGDWDGDGAADLLARTTTGALVLYRGDGAGAIAGSAVIGSGWSGLRIAG